MSNESSERDEVSGTAYHKSSLLSSFIGLMRGILGEGTYCRWRSRKRGFPKSHFHFLDSGGWTKPKDYGRGCLCMTVWFHFFFGISNCAHGGGYTNAWDNCSESPFLGIVSSIGHSVWLCSNSFVTIQNPQRTYRLRSLSFYMAFSTCSAITAY